MSKSIAIFSCKKIRDVNCIACIKCFKAFSDRAGEFERYLDEDDVEIVAMSHCGDCPGLLIPRTVLLLENLRAQGREVDTIHFGTCLVKATETAACPINLEKMKNILETKFNKKVVIGTHNY
ncbi:CGGC domain-containing protein [Desulfofalx alkaliphila]|uniref:CGGC domain-containing protein n=1 Tax=Desulfofalx alkaliphila TaxID=105483 RepID=UPI0004E1E4F7|nr:CGGC domain-containing protein [Desulfofalx alkaliphila]